nr:centrosomal protein of 135 kDa isoform X2 [Onthophagus taurus]
MEQRYLTVRSQLEELGYTQQFQLDSLPLVEKLVGDLLKTTESLQKYMKLSQDILTERDTLLLGAEPYKCDNAKLVKECNDLHLAFLQYKERSEKNQQELKNRVCELERVKTDCNKENEELKSQVKVLEENSLKSNRQIKSTATKPFKTSTAASLKPKITPRETSSAMCMAENKISNLTKEINRLKNDKLELAQANIAYKNQVNSRDKEIKRLTQMLHGGRPLEALNQDCCYKDIEVKIAKLQDEVANLKRLNFDLETRLKDAITKQHEAMKRALNLAEKNKILEKELKDIDQMALAVEHECNTTVKSNTETVNRLQNRLHEAVLQVQKLEREIMECKREKHELISELEIVKGEKKHLQGILESSLAEKNTASSRMAQYGIIENDLNLEIDRLVQLNAEQRRKIAELECKILPKSCFVSKSKKEEPPNGVKSKKSAPYKPKEKPPITKKYRMQSGDHVVTENSSCGYKKIVEDAATSPIKTLCPFPHPELCIKHIEELIVKEIQEKNVCFDHLKEVIGKEINELNTKANTSLEQFKEERDFYKKECDALMEKVKVMCNRTEQTDLQKKLFDKEQELSKLQQELCNILQEKQSLLIRLDSARSQPEQDYDALSYRSSTKRLERERDLLRADIQHLEEERDGLRHRISVLCEDYNQEKARLENMLRERDNEMRRMELDHREIIHSQGSKRAAINNLQDECDMLATQLKNCQAELTQQKVSYSQLKMLHEQSDRALCDCQNQLLQADKSIGQAQETIKLLEAEKENGKKDVINLKNELLVMKNNLLMCDREKDSLLHTLDEKTEKLVAIEHELSCKSKKIENLEATISDLKNRISDNLTDRSTKEYQLKSVTSDVQNLQRELESSKRARELALEENRRLQDDLTSCTRDNKRVQNDLDIAKRQVDDLRRQLQHYVAEIKRAEDLISQKEVERSEMLDHYKSLSEEATNLESTNHTLESEATQAKVQLSVALDHAADLERKVEVQCTMIHDYEKQISNLTAQIARLESQVEHGNIDKERIEAELISVRDLCLKLDKQKDNLMKQLNDKDSVRTEINRECNNLRRNSQTLQSELDKERNTVENLEKHLVQIRQESVEMKLLNEELRADVQKLKVNIQDLQSKLISTTEQLDLYQEKALDYSNQNKQLRREVANERFYRAKAEDSKRYPSL